MGLNGYHLKFKKTKNPLKLQAIYRLEKRCGCLAGYLTENYKISYFPKRCIWFALRRVFCFEWPWLYFLALPRLMSTGNFLTFFCVVWRINRQATRHNHVWFPIFETKFSLICQRHGTGRKRMITGLLKKKSKFIIGCYWF